MMKQRANRAAELSHNLKVWRKIFNTGRCMTCRMYMDGCWREDMFHLKPRVLCSVFCVWCLVFGVWCLVFDV